MRLAPLLIILVARPCFADALADVRSTLEALGGKQPVRAKVSFSLWRETKGEKAIGGTIALHAEDGPDGLRLSYGAQQMGLLLTETRAQSEDSDAPIPLRLATQETSVPVVAELLCQAEPLLRALSHAKLVSDRVEDRDGKPTRLLELEVAPALPPGMKKRVKKVEDRLKIWLGEDGVPVATEETLKYSGSVVVVSFEGALSQTQKLAKVGDRLVVMQRSSEDEASGFGAAVHSRKSVTLTLP